MPLLGEDLQKDSHPFVATIFAIHPIHPGHLMFIIEYDKYSPNMPFHTAYAT